jgi:hypothetical protein
LANPAGDALTPEQITKILRDIASAVRKRWITITCKHCDRDGKYEVDVPDDKTRLDSVKFMVEHGFGKPGQAKPDERIEVDIDVQTLTLEARATLRRKLLALNPDLPQTWIG